MPTLRVKEDERVLGRDPAENQVAKRLLPLRREHPRGRKRWLTVRGQLLRNGLRNSGLILSQHPVEWYGESGVRRHLDDRRLELAMPVLQLRMILVWMLKNPSPFLIVHEHTGLGPAWR